MATALEINSFLEGQVSFLKRDHQQLAAHTSFEEFLEYLPPEETPYLYWDEESAIIRYSLFGRFADFEVFEFCSAFNRMLAFKQIEMELQAEFEEHGVQCYFTKPSE